VSVRSQLSPSFDVVNFAVLNVEIPRWEIPMADEQKAEARPKPAADPKAPAAMAVAAWESDLTRLLAEQFPGEILEFSSYLGQDFLVAKPGAVIPIIEFLKLEADFDYLVDITAVDYRDRAERFDLVYILYSFARNQRIRVKTRLADGTAQPSATGVHPTADWLEREVYDMFGIEFTAHPGLKRILLPEDWQGHPLRKDYNILQMDNRWVKENLGIESGQ